MPATKPATDLYPPAPRGVPGDFTRSSPAYQRRTLAVLAGLFMFLLLYLVLIAATGYAGWRLAYALPRLSHSDSGAFVFIASGLVAVFMLLLFLVKGLFKSQKTDRSHYVAVTRAEQPELFRFIDRVCEETRAPRPAGVYVSPDVNAAVFYNTSLFNLIVPPRKYLLIGAGLVNAVNLREFKAVLAHEFGHFSQKSLALGTYVYVANRVLRDIVYGRDSWDDVLRYWCRVDLRLSFPAWALRAVVWVIRRALEQVFKGINLLNLALSRQMEFNADDVAVSVAGSDAIVGALCRIEFADRCHALTARELSAAADLGLHSRDIFHHQRRAAAHLRAAGAGVRSRRRLRCAADVAQPPPQQRPRIQRQATLPPRRRRRTFAVAAVRRPRGLVREAVGGVLPRSASRSPQTTSRTPPGSRPSSTPNGRKPNTTRNTMVCSTNGRSVSILRQ